MKQPSNEEVEKIVKGLEERWIRLKQVLRSGCKCLTNQTTGESTECEVCRKARENIQ